MSPIAFGSSALGAIVSISTRAPNTTAAQAEVGMGSYGTVQGGAAASWAGERLKAYAGAHWQHSDGDFLYPSNNGTAFDPSDDGDVPRRNNGFSQIDGTVRLTVSLTGDRELGLLGSLFSREQGLPGYGVSFTREVSLGPCARSLRSPTARGTTSATPAGSRARRTSCSPRPGFATACRRSPMARPAPGIAPAPWGPAGTPRRPWARPPGRRARRTVGGLPSIGYRAGSAPRSAGHPALGVGGPRGDHLGRSRPAGNHAVRAGRDVRDVVAGRTLFQDFVPASPPRHHLQPLARSLVQRPASWLALKANGGAWPTSPS